MQYLRTKEFGYYHLFSKTASTVGRVEDLVVENREVESQSKSDRVRGSKFSISNILHIYKKKKK